MADPVLRGLVSIIVLIYGLLARSEEKRMLALFGEEYRAYQRRVPMFIPGAGPWRQLVEYSNVKEAGKPPRDRNLAVPQEMLPCIQMMSQAALAVFKWAQIAHCHPIASVGVNTRLVKDSRLLSCGQAIEVSGRPQK